MIEHILTWLAGIIETVISAGGYPGIALLMAIESACVPLPSEVIMPFAGYLAFKGQFSRRPPERSGAISARSLLMRSASAAGGR